MRSTLLKIFLSLLSLCFIPVVTVTRAQESVTVIGFTTAGQTQILRYVQSRAAIVPTIQEAVTSAVDRYNRLFGASAPAMFIDVIATGGAVGEDASSSRETMLVPPPTGSLAAAARRDVCFIEVDKNSPTEFPDAQWRFEIAHEVAHCYQHYHLVEPDPIDSPEADWWTEGTAEWMASLVYPPSSAGAYWADHQDLFVRRMGGELLAFSYDAYYFWQFLAGSLGESGVINFLRGMPAAPTQHEVYLSGQFADLDTLFHDYGLAVARRSLSYLPGNSQLWGQHVENIAALPANVDLSTQQLSFNLYRLNISGLEPGSGLTLTASNLSPSHTQVSLSNGTELPELTPVTICGNVERISVVLSRGLSSEPPSGVLHISAAPCVTPPPAATGAVPDCLVGNWYVSHLPDFPGVSMEITGGQETIVIGADGAVQVTVNDFQITNFYPEVVTTVSDTTGSYQITSIGPDGAVTADHVEVHMGTAVVVTGGQTINVDLSSASGGSSSVAMVASRITCLADGTVSYAFTTQGQTYEYILSRAN